MVRPLCIAVSVEGRRADEGTRAAAPAPPVGLRAARVVYAALAGGRYGGPGPEKPGAPGICWLGLPWKARSPGGSPGSPQWRPPPATAQRQRLRLLQRRRQPVPGLVAALKAVVERRQFRIDSGVC